MAASAVMTAQELKDALDANMRRIENQAEHLAALQAKGAWKLVPAAREALDDLFDARIALRARR